MERPTTLSWSHSNPHYAARDEDLASAASQALNSAVPRRKETLATSFKILSFGLKLLTFLCHVINLFDGHTNSRIQ